MKRVFAIVDTATCFFNDDDLTDEDCDGMITTMIIRSGFKTWDDAQKCLVDMLNRACSGEESESFEPFETPPIRTGEFQTRHNHEDGYTQHDFEIRLLTIG